MWPFSLKKKEVPVVVEGARITCIPEAIANAWAWGQQYRTPVRMAVQHIEPGLDHVQAQALIKEVWTPLIVIRTAEINGGTAVPGPRQFPVEPYRYVGLEEWIKEQIQYVI